VPAVLRSTSCDVLLVAADWESRALLLAELQEAGYSVTAAPALRHAYRALMGQKVRPRLILLGTAGDEDAMPSFVEQLAELAPGIPTVLLIEAHHLQEWQPLEDRVAALLRRPVSVGEVVEVVRRLLTGPATKTGV
jgi:DNA-binding NtrC family response regulator